MHIRPLVLTHKVKRTNCGIVIIYYTTAKMFQSYYGMSNDKKRCTRLAATNNKVYQLLAHGRWFSPGIPASSTTKTGHHDIAEILLKVALSTKNKINQIIDY
jgi:hypothetical protein